MKGQHETAYLLAKGNVQRPADPLPDVLDWHNSGNRFHPTEKPVDSLKPLIEAFCPAEGVVLDPFCGSASTLVAARDVGRDYIGIELDGAYHRAASARLNRRNPEPQVRSEARERSAAEYRASAFWRAAGSAGHRPAAPSRRSPAATGSRPCSLIHLDAATGERADYRPGAKKRRVAAHLTRPAGRTLQHLALAGLYGGRRSRFNGNFPLP